MTLSVLHLMRWKVNLQLDSHMSANGGTLLYSLINYVNYHVGWSVSSFFFANTLRKKTQLHSTLIIRSTWAIFSFLYWWQVSSARIVQSSWCYIRQCEMEEFAEFDISLWTLCDSAASPRGEINFFVFQFRSHTKITITVFHTNTNTCILSWFYPDYKLLCLG